MDKKEIGRKGEELAVKYLRNRGYEILKQNFRHKRAEIDIISKQDDRLIFVEVKLRSKDDYGDPEQFVTKAQENRIIDAAEEFILAEGWHGDIRFDIIVIEQQEGEWVLEQFEDAFY